jgi:hypothetical protein
MKKHVFIVLLISVFSCSSNPETFVSHLDGYWEIDEVIQGNGNKLDYNFNDTIDYIEVIDSLSGFRSKLKPNLMGTFETSKDKELFNIKIENDSLNIYYKTPYAEWKETILDANETQLVIVNNTNKDVYIYKRYEPLDLNLESK